MNLGLAPLGRSSSWGSLLRAYELWTFDDEDAHPLFSHQLMLELPADLDSKPKPPTDLYWAVRDLAAQQVEIMDGLLESAPSNSHTRITQVRGFWNETFPAALARPFTGAATTLWHNLLSLEADFRQGP